MKKIILFVAFVATCSSLIGQAKPIGSWTDHLPLSQATSIASDGNLIYAATETGLFTYSTADNSLQKYTKVNLLSDVSIAKIAYDFTTKTLIIVYDNANIDLLQNGNISNIPFIKLSRETKGINDITIVGEFAYLSMDYGITVVNLLKKEIADTYKFGANGSEIKVNSTALFQDSIYAATNSGIYKASLAANLLDFNSWSKVPFKPGNTVKTVWNHASSVNFVFATSGAKDSILSYDGTKYSTNRTEANFDFVHLSKTINGETILTTNTNIYRYNEGSTNPTTVARTPNTSFGSAVANERLFQITGNAPLAEINLTDGSTIRTFRPNGPQISSIFDLDAQDGKIWVTNGAFDGTYNNKFDLARLSYFDGNQWRNYSHGQNVGLNNIFDLVSVNINPNNPDQVYFGSWGRGLVEFNSKPPFKVYQDTNTLYTNNFGQISPAIKQRQLWTSGLWVGAGETVFDRDGNLWITNTYQKNGLFVRLADGSWFSYDFSNLYSSDETAMFDIEIDDNGYKWLAMSKDNDIIVYDDNGTIKDISDDRSIRLTRTEGSGSIPGQRGIKIQKDKDGLIWIGTSDGIAVHFNPSSVFDDNPDFDRVIFFDGENNEIVLQNSIVTEIAIDGFNRKWIGTENSGVLLLSEDGKETILEFNEDNSPLLSNTISAIAIDDETGEVYIATSKGLVSYRGEAIKGEENLTAVKVYPNPVRPEYNGDIAISGLLDQTTVKITDINGTLIKELKSQGGQVLWDGNNFEGRRASSGVYLVFTSGENADLTLQTEVGKILFLK